MLSEKEMHYFNTYKRTCEVSDDQCEYGHWCATCMHHVDDTTWTGAGFQHTYCIRYKKEG